MIERLQLHNFKSFADDAEPIPLAPVTVLVGANASGKSNVFDAFRFLQGLGMGLTVAEILTGKMEGGREVFPALRGGAEEVCWNGEQTFSIRTAGTFLGMDACGEPEADVLSLEHNVTCEAKPNPRIQNELLRGGGLVPIDISPQSLRPALDFTGQRSLLAEADAKPAGTGSERVAVGRLLECYRDVRFLDLHPAEMKRYVPTAAQKDRKSVV